MQRWIIDPVIVKKSDSDILCFTVLEKLRDIKKLVEICIDKENGELLNEYKNASAKIGKWISEANFVTIPSEDYGNYDNIRNQIDRCRNFTDVDKLLIRIACNSREGTPILLAPQDKDGSPRHTLDRCIYKKKIRARLSDINIRDVDAKELVYIPFLDAEPDSKRGHWYEDKVRDFLARCKGCPRSRVETPISWHKGKPGDVDVWFQEIEEGKIRVWVGECKLSQFNDSKTLGITDKNPITQISNKIEAIIIEIKNRFGTQLKPEIICFVISNMSTMSSELCKQAFEKFDGSKIEFRYLRTKLTKNWQSIDKWKVEQIEEFKLIRDASSIVLKQVPQDSPSRLVRGLVDSWSHT